MNRVNRVELVEYRLNDPPRASRVRIDCEDPYVNRPGYVAACFCALSGQALGLGIERQADYWEGRPAFFLYTVGVRGMLVRERPIEDFETALAWLWWLCKRLREERREGSEALDLSGEEGLDLEEVGVATIQL